jgi:hypothetical protein
MSGASGPSRRICSQPSIDACANHLNETQLDDHATSFMDADGIKESSCPSRKLCSQPVSEAHTTHLTATHLGA